MLLFWKCFEYIHVAVKPVLGGYSKIDKTNSSLMKVESVAECSPYLAIIGLESIFGYHFELPIKTGFTVHLKRQLRNK